MFITFTHSIITVSFIYFYIDYIPIDLISKRLTLIENFGLSKVLEI